MPRVLPLTLLCPAATFNNFFNILFLEDESLDTVSRLAVLLASNVLTPFKSGLNIFENSFIELGSTLGKSNPAAASLARDDPVAIDVIASKICPSTEVISIRSTAKPVALSILTPSLSKFVIPVTDRTDCLTPPTTLALNVFWMSVEAVGSIEACLNPNLTTNGSLGSRSPPAEVGVRLLPPLMLPLAAIIFSLNCCSVAFPVVKFCRPPLGMAYLPGVIKIAPAASGLFIRLIPLILSSPSDFFKLSSNAFLSLSSFSVRFLSSTACCLCRFVLLGFVP